jgi:hypothetical protein
MASQQPASDFDDELLSAYVDNELTADQRAAVEERLRTDDRARQLVEELRGVSQAVKSLPRERLRRDLRDSVLAQIERRASNESPEKVTLPCADVVERRTSRGRGLVWAALAIAAALILMVFRPDEWGDGRRVAQAPSGAEQPGRDRERSAGETPKLSAAGPADEIAGVETRRDRAGTPSGLAGRAPRSAAQSVLPASAEPSALNKLPTSAAAVDVEMERYELTVADEAGVRRFEQLLVNRGIVINEQAMPAERLIQPDRGGGFGGGGFGGVGRAVESVEPQDAGAGALVAEYVVVAAPDMIAELATVLNESKEAMAELLARQEGGAAGESAIPAATPDREQTVQRPQPTGQAWRIVDRRRLAEPPAAVSEPAADEAAAATARDGLADEAADGRDRAARGAREAAEETQPGDGHIRALFLLRRPAGPASSNR